MEYVYIGKIVGTHGIKGEIRIISNFEKKELVFKPDMEIYIGNKKEKEVIISYRKHKNYDMITLKGLNNINAVLKYKGLKAYVARDSLNLSNNSYILDDLLGMHIMCDNIDYGIVEDIFDNNGNTLLQISFEKNYYIPYNSSYIRDVDLEKKEINTINIKDLIL